MIRYLKTITKYIDDVYCTFRPHIGSSSLWYFAHQLPSVIFYAYQLTHMPMYKTKRHNTRVWDSFTMNDFKKGNLIEFLSKMNAIKRYTFEDAPDGRGYFIGYIDED
jgi:hypothetical protein